MYVRPWRINVPSWIFRGTSGLLGLLAKVDGSGCTKGSASVCALRWSRECRLDEAELLRRTLSEKGSNSTLDLPGSSGDDSSQPVALAVKLDPAIPTPRKMAAYGRHVITVIREWKTFHTPSSTSALTSSRSESA
ncbi:hypothetical protein B0H19DRAFT_1174089 [Mycena capillaripes]|nr:hypothetical protein B0H19DRAFT_1174089 [Mycena capillaripes]